MKFAIHWLHMLEFAILSAGIEFIARSTHNNIIQVFSYINLYIFFMFVFSFVDEYAHAHIKCNETIRKVASLIISIFAVIAMVYLIIQIIEKHFITYLKHI